ncbi:MAG: MATE family efflux transporter [Oscillospiraceae bacterium]|nr:MATE family efflux transporter [Oscillospiraceae bacterium]
MDTTLIRDLTRGSVSRQLIHFSFPFLLANLLQLVYSLVDMVFVGQVVGSTGLAAVSVGSQLTMLFATLGMGFAAGGQIYISQQVGRGEREELRPTIGTLFTSLTLMALLITVVGCAFCRPLLQLLNTPAEAMDQAADYLFVCSLGMFFIFGYNSLCAVLRGMGDSRHPLLFVFIATVLNVVLDYLFVVVMGLEAKGAALATVAGQACSFLFAVVLLYQNRANFAFDFRLSSFAIHPERARALVKLSLPIALQQNAITISMLYVNAQINALGLVAVAVAGIGQKIQHVVGVITGAMQAAAATMVGQNMGAGKLNRVKNIVFICWAVCLAAAAVCSAAFLLFPRQIFACFDRNPEVLACAPGFLSIVCVMVFSFALMAPTNGLINGIGFTTLNLGIALLDGVIFRIGLSMLFGRYLEWGVNGYYLGNALAGYISVFLGSLYFFSGRWERRRLLQGAEGASSGEPEALNGAWEHKA